MQPDFTKGGRHKNAPYETTHVRVPVALKDYVKQLSDEYKISLEKGTNEDFINSLSKPVNEKKLISLSQQLLKLRQQKKSIKTVLDNLLTAILGEV